LRLADNVTVLPGIGPKKAEALAKLNIFTLEDLIYNFPRDYEDRRNVVKIGNLVPDETAVFTGKIDLVITGGGFRGLRKQVVRLLVSDDTGSVEVVFFNAGYLAKTIKRGSEYVFFGKPSVNREKLQVVHPDMNRASEAGKGIIPVYSLTAGISQREIRNIQSKVRSLYPETEDFLSPELISKNNLCSLEYALDNIHFPEDKQSLREARYRLIFDELLVLQTGLMAARKTSSVTRGIALTADEREYIDSLPYELTEAQKRCVREISADLESQKVMNRLVQGDVGSGKTAVAEIAMYKAVKSGYQAAMMAPTEILARQHFEGISKSFEMHEIRAGLLTGSMKAVERRETLEGISDGSIDIIIGTHAVIQPEVKFKNPGLFITDEQHRFGVGQRVRLKEKGSNPNILVMTATPIPRTLAVVLYGDLDVSVIDELPPGRKAIKTRFVRKPEGEADIEPQRRKCYEFVRQQLVAGRQAYVVTPLIEDSEVMNLKSAEQVANELEKLFEEYRVVLIHGGMKQTEKDSIMEDFSSGKIQVLVATVVIEVGINVPNATVMVVENAERFGLAQLHQLRGRVGRGEHQSYCLLIVDNESETAVRRCAVMEDSGDGFFIAEEDLKLRGPGEIFGTRQHGIPDMRIADLSRHLKVLNHARDEARVITEDDPGLTKEVNQALRRRVQKLFGKDFILNL
jgi:ATP-dependent DNA helicase RecG